MAGKRISQLDVKTPASSDVIGVADPSTGIAGKSTTAQVLVAGFNQSSVISTGSSIAYTPTTINISVATNDLAVGTVGLVFLNVTAAVGLTGISGSNTSGKIIHIVNTGTNALSVKNEDVGSIAANRIRTASGGNLNMQTGHMLICVYDGTLSRWRVWMIS